MPLDHQPDTSWTHKPWTPRFERHSPWRPGTDARPSLLDGIGDGPLGEERKETRDGRAWPGGKEGIIFFFGIGTYLEIILMRDQNCHHLQPWYWIGSKIELKERMRDQNCHPLWPIRCIGSYLEPIFMRDQNCHPLWPIRCIRSYLNLSSWWIKTATPSGPYIE